jgi:transcription initiation factor TFIIF subunit beta
MKVLREKTQQPEQYLREVLGEVASLHRSGEFTGLYELKGTFKDDVRGHSFLRIRYINEVEQIKGEGEGVKAEGMLKMEGGIKAEPGGEVITVDDDDDEEGGDDEDDDMEEVA